MEVDIEEEERRTLLEVDSDTEISLKLWGGEPLEGEVPVDQSENSPTVLV